MKKILTFLVLLLAVSRLQAQEGSFSQTLLRLPISSHVAALGGENISLTEDAPWAGLSNPALLSGVSDLSLGLNFMTYAGDSKYAGAEFVKAFGERHTGMVFGQMLGYGEMNETDASGNVLGKFSPKDMVVGVGYSYLLSDRWAGGATLKGIYSKYADFSAFAVAVDLGINYFNEDRDLSLSATMMNIGAPLKSFDDRTERLPFNLQVGFTKGMAHAPVRFSLALTDLTHWRDKDFFHPSDEKMKFTTKALSHIVIGVDIEPTKFLYLSAGYNFRRAYELKAAGESHWAGLTAGGGVKAGGFRLGVAYAKYHMACNSLIFNAGYAF